MSFRSLDELTAADAVLAGGKAWNCARLKQHGFPVPEGLVVPADATDTEIAAVDRDPWFDRWSDRDRFAVRSSGLGEDSAGQSFAGIHETRLNVARADVVDAIKACRESTCSARAVAYQNARGIADASLGTGVLVQRMVQPVASGVAFTIDPVSGAADEMVINAAPGLGTAVVDGRMDPDEIRVRKRDGPAVSYRVGAADRRALGDTGAVRELATLLLRIEQHYGSPQDVEWCFDGTVFWIVQSRPITVRAPAEDIEWTRANLAEVLPEITSPQALDAIERLLNTAERRYMGRLLAPHDALGPMVRAFNGRLYFNVSQLRHICRMTGTPPAAVLRSIGHSADIDPRDEQAPRPGWAEWIQCLPDMARILSRHLRAGRIFRAHQGRIRTILSQLAAVDARSQSDRQLWDALLEWERRSPDSIEVVLLFGGVLFHELRLRSICERTGYPFERLLYAYLATGERSVSSEQAFDLVALAEIARGEPAATDFLSRDAALSDAHVALGGTRFLAAFEQFLERYGHRGLYESDWALPRYREDPTPLLQAIRMHVRDGCDQSRAATVARVQREAATIQTEFERRMTGIRRWTLLPRARRLLATIKRYYVWREQCRSDMLRVMAVLRGWHLVLARRFVERGWLDRVGDYFYLHLVEIAATIENPVIAPSLREIVARRCEEAERYRQIDMPLLLQQCRGGPACPPHDGRHSTWGRHIGRPLQDDFESSSNDDLRGVPVSRGSVEAEIVVIDVPGDVAHMKRGAILVTRATDPSWTPIFTLASGVIVEVGGVLSHASTIAREYGLPALANVKDATRRLKTGDRVLLNATEGWVRRVS